MKKNILFFINGFGIEKADSYNVYSASLMPNMEALRTAKENMFFSIPDKYLDYKSAYRNFSIGIDDSLSYNLIEQNIYNNEYKSNQLIQYITNELNKNNSKLHIFVYWDSTKTIEYLSFYLKEIDKLTKAKIFVHVILCQKSLNDYKEIEKGFNVLSYEVNSSVKIGLVTGEKNFRDSTQMKEVIKALITEFGEKWKDIPKRINVSLESKTIPCENRTFAVNIGYSVSDNDQVLFFNFSNVDVLMFRNELGLQKFKPLNLDSVMFYSLFPVKCGDRQVPFMYNYAIASNCFLNSLKSVNVKALVLDKKDNCTYINYYLTGLRNAVEENLKYLSIEESFFDNPNNILDTLKNYDNQLYIINYDISAASTLEDLKSRLKKADDILGILAKHCTDNNMGLFVSSLYGIEKEMFNQKLEKCKINFSGRAPVIIVDNDLDFSKYTHIEPGSLYDLSNSVIWNTNKEYKTSGLLKKKSALFSIFYKKPKEEKK